MHFRNIYIIFLFYVCSLTGFLFSQSLNYNNLTFEHLSIEHGLSQITVHSILQDSKGFLWFGTEDGLNRYDGYSFTIYRHDPSDSNSISDNFIWSIIEDSDSNIWVGTNSGGLNKYSYRENSFFSYSKIDTNNKSPLGNNVRVLFEDSEDNLWIGTNNSGLYKLNKSAKKIEKIDLLENQKLSIRALCQDQSGAIWIGTNNRGLFSYNTRNNTLNHFPILSNDSLKIQNNSIWALSCDKQNNIWVGTYNSGLYKFDRKVNRFIEYLNTGHKNSIINNNITSIIIDEKNNPWICTEDGLSIYDQVNNEFYNYQHNLSDLRSLSNSFLRIIFKDNSNLVWIGTVGGGINKLNLLKKFNQYNHNPTDENSISHNMIRTIEGDSKGNIWIGTLGNGINRFDKETNHFQRFNSKNSNLSEDIVTSILEDKNKNLWVGTWGGGINKITFFPNSTNYKIKNIEFYKHSATKLNSLSSNIIQDIYEDSKGDLWIGTEDGLNKLNSKTNTFTNFKYDPENSQSISDSRIQSNCLVEDKFGYLWIGTWQGLNRIKIDSNNLPEKSVFFKISKNDGLSDNRAISIYIDKSNSNTDSLFIWVGTIGGGLNKLSLLVNDIGEIIDYSINVFMEKDGLPSNVIYGILGDEEENLWLSTNNGLSKFNFGSKQFRNFNIDDGLQSNQFFWGAFHKALDGELYFGGINGMNSFYPDKLIENENIPPVYITKCIIESGDGTVNKVFENIEEIRNNRIIELDYDSYNLEIHFASLDFTTPSKNKYKYILENYNEDWIEHYYFNSVSFSGIKDGDYKFIVLGSNNDDIWNTTGASISIIIKTPFWKTWWFILLSILLISVLVAYLIVGQVKNILSIERLRTKLAADLHDNIGSSLTEISILSEVISNRIKTEDKDIKYSLEKISNKSRKLIDKMSDIVWLVNPQRDSLYDLILRLQDTYSDLLSDTKISFRSENLKSLEKVSLSMEHRQHLFLIFKEAINNSITHSRCSELVLNAQVHNRTLTMVLEDNGIGFETSQDKNGNGLINMKNRAQNIRGKLFITSIVGKGTIVKYIGIVA